jgi:hypothetical protein
MCKGIRKNILKNYPLILETSKLKINCSFNIDEADDYLDDEVEPEPDPSEMSVGQLLGRQNEDGDYGYSYEEEDY